MDWYTKYAKYYDTLLDGCGIKPDKIVDELDKLFKKHGVKKVLDLRACTGTFLISLKKKGYEVEGTEKNDAMLKIAKEKCGRESINIMKGEEISFNKGKYDAVICIYNKIGHLSKGEFKQMVKNVKKLLNPEGLFFFDIFNFEFMKKNFNTKEFMDIAREHNGMMAARFNKNELDRKNKIMRIHQTTFIQDGGLRIEKDDWDFQIYSKEEIDKVLIENGFEILANYGSIYIGEEFAKFDNERSISIVTLARSKK